MSATDSMRERWPLAALVATAAAYTFGVLWRRSWHALGQPSYDIYGFFYPNQVYAWRALRDGAGLLWNPYQECGAPFFAFSQVGLLYPVNVVFALLDREPALLASTLLNLGIAGAGTYLLGRALRLAPAAALCAAVAFQLGWVATWLASWSPIHIGALAWLPVALWRTERLAERPSVSEGIALAIVLALAHLPGFYQTGYYIYQLIAWRILWACAVERAAHPARLAALTAAALLAGAALVAVQLLPAAELTRWSLRSLDLSAQDVGGGFSWAGLARALAEQIAFQGNVAIVLLAIVALAALCVPPRWRGDPPDQPAPAAVAFYALVAALYFVLSLGPGSLLYDLYERLPFGSAFRGAWRLVWVTNLAIAVLAGCGAHLLLASGTPRRRALAAGVLLGAGAVLYALAPGALGAGDAVVVVALAAGGIASARPALVGGARVATPALLALGCLALSRPPLPLFGLRQGDLYDPHAATFEAVRARLTPQERVMLVGRFPDFALMPKSASLFRLRSIFDYDTLASRTYADFFTYMRTGRRLHSLQDWYWIVDRLLPPTLQRPLLDVTAARYLIVDRQVDRVEQVLRGGVRLVAESDAVRVYENEQALARARYVGQVVVANDDDALAQLAASRLDPTRVAWVSTAPASGFLGSAGADAGSAEIASDRPERVIVHVRAPRPGFLLLADQYFPGWTAEVNGVASEILRANVAFRVVEVPAGESEVVFAYRPRSLWLGAAVSAVTAALLGVAWRRARRPSGAAAVVAR